MTSRPRALAAVLAVLAALAISAPVEGAAAGRGDAKPAAFTEALARALEGNVPLEQVRISGGEAGDEFTLFGRGVGFFRHNQIHPDANALAAILRRVQSAGFADMPATFGGSRRGGADVRSVPVRASPRPASAERVVASLSVRIGSVEKAVTQLSGGETPKDLNAFTELHRGIVKDVGPFVKDGLLLDELSFQDALGKIAKGDLAPEALAVSVAFTPKQKQGSERPWRLALSGGALAVDGKAVAMSPRDSEAAARRLAALLGGQELDKLPRQLYHARGTLSLQVSILDTELSLDVSADDSPANEKQKSAHPKEQAAFDDIVAALSRMAENPTAATAPAPFSQPAD